MRTLALMSTVLCLGYSGIAQSVPTEKEALKDAEYALRRFEEVTSRIDFNYLKAPGTTIGKTQDVEVKMTQTKNVDEAKDILKRFDNTRKPTSAELLDIMSDLERAASALSDLSNLLIGLRDPEITDKGKVAEMNALSLELNTTSNTTYLAMTEVYVVLKNQIEHEEDLLKRCARRPPQQKKKGASASK